MVGVERARSVQNRPRVHLERSLGPLRAGGVFAAEGHLANGCAGLRLCQSLEQK